jgi:arginase family enzyme
VRSTDPVAVAVVGVPFDSAASHHAGARFGPEAIRAGFSPLHGMLAFLRALAGMRCMGFDMDEVSPSHGGPGQRTAMLAANVAYESLALSALAGERS